MRKIDKRSVNKWLLLGFMWLITTFSFAQSADENYILKRTYIDTLGHYTATVRYFDGLGRPYREVLKDAVSPGTDLVTATEYDSQGRDSLVWLPVRGAGGRPLSDAEIRNAAQMLYGDARAYTLNLYEPSALGRIAARFGPGTAWAEAGKAVRSAYRSNSETDARLMCRKYAVRDSVTLQKQGYYPAASLFVTETADEDGNTTLQFKTTTGQLLLERRFQNGPDGPALDTYYVYDGHGMLCWVLPPLAADALGADGYWTVASEALDRYAYFYRYDGRQQPIVRKLPGCEPEDRIYDKGGRLALMQDGNLRSEGRWRYYQYDAFGNVTVTGVCRLSDTRPLADLREWVRKHVYARCRFLVPGEPLAPDETAGCWADGSSYGYTAGTLSITEAEPTTVSYYDYYDFLALPGFTGKGEYAAGTYNAKGRLTGSVSAVYGSRDTIRTVYRYDRKGLLHETVSNNLLGGYDLERQTYTFTGLEETQEKVHTSSASPQPVSELYTYTYDAWGRLLATDHRLNGGRTVRLCTNEYDALGRVGKKKLNDDRYATSYAYNIRSQQTAQTGPLFSQQLYYNTGVGTPCYNGNISSMTWKAGSEDILRGYRFTYDGLSRLTAATYGEGNSIASNLNRYTERLSYDKMGNILSLKRYGKLSASSFGPVDDLTLSYTGNRLKRMTDAVTAPVSEAQMHVTDGANAATEYAYDANGNLVTDLNKGIVQTTYNLLNLPQKISFANGDSVRYCYVAPERKLQVRYFTGNDVSQIDYSGNRIYENGRLSRLLTDVGYITFGDSGAVYHYYLSDYQGNNRVVIASDGSIEQVNHYYPGGSVFGESIGASVQNRKYGGKELDTHLGLNWSDYGARYYDGALLRWGSMDASAEKYFHVSPYLFCLGNPVRYTDPDGKDVWDFVGGIIHSIGSNLSLGTLRGNGDFASDADHYELGRQVGNLISVALGSYETTLGSGLIMGGGLITIGTGGLGGEVGVPAAAVGAGVVSHGASVIATAVADLGVRSGSMLEMSQDYSPRTKGGGKNASHANEKRREAAKQKYEDAKKEYTELKNSSDRSSNHKRELNKKRKEMEHWKRKADFSGEQHSQKHKGR